ncbi:hypothetical protein CHS0354_006947 [Potamilus streckersoni]|uniref:Uncharacterized protein n=1 Tax=Potamilus streckersoni TaxID=2493646 RepID=A0AAE0TES3_9BIVA|nr:hypothetical protein CHS0354_006947 [Potamilus streckersoni]
MRYFTRVLIALHLGFIIPQIASAQIILQYKIYGKEEFKSAKQSDEKASYEKTNPLFRFRIPYPASGTDFYALIELQRDDKILNPRGIANETLRSGNVITQDKFPRLLRSDLYHIGVGYRASGIHQFFYGLQISENTAGTDAVDDTRFYTNLFVYDYYYAKNAYFRFLAGAVNNPTYSFYFVAPAYYYEGEKIHVRITPVYLRTYYDLNDKWQVNFKVNEDSRFYRLNSKDFDRQLLKYTGRELNTGIQYRFSENLLFNLDFGYQVFSELKFFPEHYKDADRLGKDTIGIKPAPYAALYITLGPRNHPE